MSLDALVLAAARRYLALAASAAGLVCAGGPAVPQSAEPSPAGLWRTFGDDGAKPRALVRIVERHGELVGTIMASLVPGEDGNDTCDLCPGALKGKPVIGMVFLSGLRFDGHEYRGGEILDPDTGQTYRASARVEAGGRRLVVRGYIGVPLLGRSQTWERVE